MRRDNLHTVCHLGGADDSLPRAALRVIEVGDAPANGAGNMRGKMSCRVECGTRWGPQATTRIGGVSPLSLLTFFAAAKKVSAAPHRGNACSTDTKSRMPAGCQR
ncbi:hypothetical protein FRZ40_06900 [Paraburkholderia azotifigens]|uniref:Uncharacterized protein n=1 Tax=Paraburkholderia azotifigens TaxID=2057004 RepID=A0A5C6VQQ1_9BURK|nr:hypothetical protein FRZ40_06900 [Paraburkholderia azotifigens]